MARYSRRRSVEERKNVRRAFFFGILTIGVLLLFLFFGLPTVAKFAAFLHDLRSTNQPVDVTDTTPPAPPKINDLPEFTNETSLDISGRSEPGATILIEENGKEDEVLANKDGEFQYTWSLLDGQNKISAKAKDAAGNESVESDVQLVTYDNQPPDLSIDSPQDGASFYGSKERQLTIKGHTEENASVTINDRIVVVDSLGDFSLSTTLSDGDNSFDVTAKDQAGNETKSSFTVHYSP